jgi:four helix bundle protein
LRIAYRVSGTVAYGPSVIEYGTVLMVARYFDHAPAGGARQCQLSPASPTLASRARPVVFSDWIEQIPPELTEDALWSTRAYRLALFLADCAWDDVRRLQQDRCAWALADQLQRSAGSIAANVAEGYGRGSGRDRAHFLEIALGSAREARGWYFLARRSLGAERVAERVAVLTEVVRLLLATIPVERRSGWLRPRTREDRISARGERRK